jgi:malignant T-cell-amplified sequence
LVKGVRSHLKGKEVKLILERISKALSLSQADLLEDNSSLQVTNLDPGSRVFFVDDLPAFIEFGAEVFPTLVNERVLNKLSSLTVNMGAIPHVCNGADIMSPGVIKVNGVFSSGMIVVIVEEKFSKKIAIARALVSSDEIIGKKQGKAAENLHYIGDKYWKAIKQ